MPYTTQNMVQPVHDYPRRYTAKQLKTIYYSLIEEFVMNHIRMKWVSPVCKQFTRPLRVRLVMDNLPQQFIER